MIQWWRPLGIALVTLASAATFAPLRAGTLEGTAFYRERIALPPDAVFEALLQDVSRADSPGDVLGRARLEPAGQTPFRFVIAYDDNAIRPGLRYAIRATVTHRGRLLFTTDRVYPVLDGRDTPLEMLLVSARSGGQTIPRAEQDESAGPVSLAQDNVVVLTGMFRYMADAPTITLCAEGPRFPVAMQADYKALEAAYLRTRHEPGEALLVEIEGTVAMRPGAEEGALPQPTLVVTRFIDVLPRETCEVAMNDSPLRNTYWKLVRLGGTRVETTERQGEPYLVLAAEEMRVSGSGGCNRFAGSFSLDGDKLRFGRLASTMMACPQGMEQEQRFYRSLETVEYYRIVGTRLDLLNSARAVVAEFEAVAQR